MVLIFEQHYAQRGKLIELVNMLQSLKKRVFITIVTLTHSIIINEVHNNQLTHMQACLRVPGPPNFGLSLQRGRSTEK